MADRREIITILTGRETISDAARRAERGLDDLGDEMRSTERDADLLDRRIDEVNRSLRALASQYARTGDDAFVKRIREQERELRRLTRIRRMLDFGRDDDAEVVRAGVRIGSRMAEGISRGMARAGGPIVGAMEGLFGSMPPQVQVAVGGAVVAGIGSVAPIVAGTLAGAVVGAAGVGGVVGGLVAAARHQDVQTAAKSLGDTVVEVLDRSVGPAFVSPAIEAIEILRGDLLGMEDDFERLSRSASRFVRPLTYGVSGLVRELLPGLERAVDRGGPIIDELASWLPRLGQLLTDVFSDFADQVPEATQALRAFWTVFEFGIRTVADHITVLTELYRWADLASAALTGNLHDALMRYKVAEVEAARGGNILFDSIEHLIGGFVGFGDEADEAEGELRELRDAIDDLFGRTMNLDEATDAYHQGLIDLRKELSEGKRTIEGNSQAAIDNRERIREQIRAINDLRNARINQGMATDEANRKYEEELDALRDLLIQMGYNATAVNRLIDRYRNIPRQVTTNIYAMGTDQAGRVIETYLAWLRRIPSEVRTRIVAEQRTARGGFREFSAGGPVDGRGPRGVDSVPAILAPGEHVWTHEEVQAAGGHARVEALRRAVLSGSRTTAPVPWAPLQPVPTSSGPTTVRFVSDGSRLSDLIVEIIREAVRVEGRGDVQVAFGQ